MDIQTRKKRLRAIYGALLKLYGPQRPRLDHVCPLELMVAVILSAQCTDDRVNIVTKELFRRCRSAEDYAKISPSELEGIIKSCGFYRTKAAHITGACKIIFESHKGHVPRSMEELTALPGIGRKSANVILGNAFGVPGFAVDTHVIRLSNRIGFAATKDPVKIEEAVTGALPDKYWTEFSHLLIKHGRTRCPARKPDCPACEIRGLCDYPAKG